MSEQISKMDKQLQDTPRVSLVIAIEQNKGKRNACVFLGIVVLAVLFFSSWNRWLLLIPGALGVGAFLYHMNIVLISSELKRRFEESEESGEVN